MAGLQGRVALVTGGASGLGASAARHLAEAGANVLVADIDAGGGQRVAEEVGGRFAQLDVSDPAAWKAVVSGLGGGLDVVFLNAGVSTGSTTLEELTVPQYRRAVGVNLDGVVLGMRAVLPALNDHAAVIATASLGGLTPMPVDPVYSATKHAVVAFVRSIAPQLGPRGITVNAVCPGFADTGIVTAELREWLEGTDVPLLDPDVVGRLVVELALGTGTGEAWVCQPGREPLAYAFRGVPGPRRTEE